MQEFELRRNNHFALIDEDDTSLCTKFSLTKRLNKTERYLTCHPKKGLVVDYKFGGRLSRVLMYSIFEDKISMFQIGGRYEKEAHTEAQLYFHSSDEI